VAHHALRHGWLTIGPDEKMVPKNIMVILPEKGLFDGSAYFPDPSMYSAPRVK
jgi:hypothetical protein